VAPGGRQLDYRRYLKKLSFDLESIYYYPNPAAFFFFNTVFGKPRDYYPYQYSEFGSTASLSINSLPVHSKKEFNSVKNGLLA
jgi:hypothetical protein